MPGTSVPSDRRSGAGFFADWCGGRAHRPGHRCVQFGIAEARCTVPDSADSVVDRGTLVFNGAAPDIHRRPGACGRSLRGSCLQVNGGRVVV